MNESLLAIKRLIDKQAEDEGLWFIAETAPEAYLQQELRRLHGAIEHLLKTDACDCDVSGFTVFHNEGCWFYEK